MPSQGETKRVAVVMAGGSGERFWPLSRKDRPKQLLCLSGGDSSLLAETIGRLTPLIPPEDTFIATGEHLIEPIRAAKVGVPDANVIAEPCKRNTSGGIAYATAHILAKYATPDAPPASKELQRRLSMAIVTADHLIGDADAFRFTVKAALDAAAQEHALAIIGIVPTRPETGYGYIHVEDIHRPLSQDPSQGQVFRVQAFHEKPDYEQAQAFVGAGTYFWNAGMFFWTVETFMSELEAARPELAEATLAMADAMRAGDEARVRGLFEQLDDVSIDYALMEHARHVIVARAAFPWDDVGSWPSLDRTHARDEQGNVLIGNPVAVDCRNCIIYRDSRAKDIAVVGVGLEGLVLVVTDDAILVIPKKRSQDVKYAVAELKKRNAKQL